MEIEQRPPNGPNFLLVVILSGVAILIFFVVALFVMHIDIRHMHPHHQTRLVLPATGARAPAQQQV